MSTQSLELIKSIMLVIALFSSVRVAFVRHIVKNVIINSLAFAKGARNVANTLQTSTRKCVMVSTYAHFTLLQTVPNRRLVTYRSIPTKRHTDQFQQKKSVCCCFQNCSDGLTSTTVSWQYCPIWPIILPTLVLLPSQSSRHNLSSGPGSASSA